TVLGVRIFPSARIRRFLRVRREKLVFKPFQFKAVARHGSRNVANRAFGRKCLTCENSAVIMCAVFRITQLPNGVRVTTAEMPYMDSISLGLWVGVGGRYESARLSGASHFIEHLLFKGTRRRSAKQISQTVEGVGGYLNAFTGEETTCYYAK